MNMNDEVSVILTEAGSNVINRRNEERNKDVKPHTTKVECFLMPK